MAGVNSVHTSRALGLKLNLNNCDPKGTDIPSFLFVDDRSRSRPARNLLKSCMTGFMLVNICCGTSAGGASWFFSASFSSDSSWLKKRE